MGANDSKCTTGRHARWARTLLRQVQKTVRRLARMGRGIPDESDDADGRTVSFDCLQDGTRIIRRVQANTQPGNSCRPTKRKKPGRISRGAPVMKYGVQVPRNVRHAYELDESNGNTYWRDAIEKEISSLLALNCFDFRSPGFRPGNEFQQVRLII